MQNEIQKTLHNFMVNCMLNPENEDFYICSLTFEKIENILNRVNDDDFTQFFWMCLHKAENIVYNTELEYFAEIECELNLNKLICEDCGCALYQTDSICPNCGA